MTYLSIQSLINPVFLSTTGIVVLAALIFCYYMYRKEKKIEEKSMHVSQNYDQLVQEAKAKAKAIIDQAGMEAATILAQSQNTKLNLDMKSEETFKKITDEQMQLLRTNSEEYFRSYTSSLEEVKHHYASLLEQMLADIRDSTQKEIQELKAILKNQLTQSQGSVTKQMQDDFMKAQIEINEYKKHELERIDKSMNDLLIRVSEEILGKMIPIRDHQQLIIDSLEMAKKEGMFNI